jgi:hypothetical protein
MSETTEQTAPRRASFPIPAGVPHLAKQVITIGDLRQFIDGLPDDMVLGKAVLVPAFPTANVTGLVIGSYGQTGPMLVIY